MRCFPGWIPVLALSGVTARTAFSLRLVHNKKHIGDCQVHGVSHAIK
jgi:hypothetical protein